MDVTHRTTMTGTGEWETANRETEPIPGAGGSVLGDHHGGIGTHLRGLCPMFGAWTVCLLYRQ